MAASPKRRVAPALLPRAAPSPVELRASLERLGPIPVAAGQYLSLRCDLLPREYTEALLLLADTAPAEPWSRLRQVIHDDLGRSPEELFESVNPSPLAARALSQTHVARTHDGDEVAVEIQRPDVTERLDQALRRFDRVLDDVQAAAGEPGIDRKRLLTEIRTWFDESLDVDRRIRNLDRSHSDARRSGLYRVPAPYPKLSGGRVLTTRHLPGVPLSGLVSPAHRDRAELISSLGLDGRDLAHNLVESMLAQIYGLGVFDGAPHPDNLIAMRGNVVGYISLGLVDQIDESLRRSQLRLISAIRSEDTEEMIRRVVDLVDLPDSARLSDFRSALRDEIQRLRLRSDGLGDVSPVAEHLRSFLLLARRHEIELPSPVVSMHRATVAAASVATSLSAGSSMGSLISSFVNRQEVRSVVRTLSPTELRALALDLVSLLTTGPGQLNRLLSDLADDRFVFRVATSESDGDRRAANARARVISLAVVLVGLAVLIAGTDGDVWGLRGLWYALAAVVAAALVLLWTRLE